jgi:Galactose oxidase, central domain
MTRQVTLAAFVALLFARVPAARAEVAVFSNFGPQTANYPFTSIEIALSNFSGTTDSDTLRLSLAASSASGAIATPGAVVPEPSSVPVVLSGAAIGLLAGYRRRLRRSTRRPAAKRPEAEPLEARFVLSTTFTWTQANGGASGEGTMLLYPNGTVMMQGGGNDASVYADWNNLAPSSTGNYANNTTVNVSTMSTPRLYFASQVLPNGNVFVLGGEYSDSNLDANWTNTGEIYSGATNKWSPIANFPQPYFGDDPSMLLDSGLILLGTGAGSAGNNYLYNPTSGPITAMVNGSQQIVPSNSYSSAIPNIHGDTNDEEGWVKLPNGNVLNYDEFASYFSGPNSGGYAEVFNPSLGEWHDVSPADGTAHGFIPLLTEESDGHGDNGWFELGPGLLMPNGNVFFVSGGNGNTALYNPTTNTWSAGPSLPYSYTADDAPGAVLPNGDVIFTADQAVLYGAFSGLTAMFDYSPSTNTLTQLTGSNAPADPGLADPSTGSYFDRMLVLPTGQLMFADTAYNTLWVGTPSGAPQSEWQPTIRGIAGGGGGVYTLTGTQLNGMDAGAAYGDDAQMDENYPIVRLTDGAGTVYYATTSNWSDSGVATGKTSESVTFTLPAGMPAGNYSLVVSGAGISSRPRTFHLNGGTDDVVGGATSLTRPMGLTTGQAIGSLTPPPSITAFRPSYAAVWSGSTLGALVAATGSTTIDFANAVDSLLAGEELAGIAGAASRANHRTSP